MRGASEARAIEGWTPHAFQCVILHARFLLHLVIVPAGGGGGGGGGPPHLIHSTTMLPGVGVFGTSLTSRVIIPLLKDEGFSVKALWGRTQEEAEELAKEMSVPFYTNRIDDVLLHQDVDLVCINLPPPLTKQIAVKTLGKSIARSTYHPPQVSLSYSAVTSALCTGRGLPRHVSSQEAQCAQESHLGSDQG